MWIIVGRVAGANGFGRPGGFNLGANVGRAAGQTVRHAHVHLLPRFAGDVAQPLGGVRNVIPGKGAYGGLRAE